MTLSTQQWVMGLIVALAALYVVWICLPARWRQRLGQMHPALANLSGASGCSACNRCAGCSDATTPDATRARPVALPAKAARHR